MKTILRSTFSSIITLIALNLNANEPLVSHSKIGFTENKGQVCDQNSYSRPDVLFSGSNNGLVYHLTNKGISYQLSKVDKWKESKGGRMDSKMKSPEQVVIYRVDINWLGANSNSKIITGVELPGTNNYYLSQCPKGALNVKSYSEVMYQNIYEGINLKWYEKNGELEYDFIVNPNSDYKQIKIEVKGAEKLTINKGGELEIKTPLGTIIEKAPVAFQDNKEVKAEWVLDGKEIGFTVSNYNPNLPLTIDPVIRVWGTYYGGSATENVISCSADASGNIYMAGYTDSNFGNIIATTGSHQTIFGGNFYDAFLVQFNSSGVRQWGTYYGGNGNDYAYSCKANASGDVYLAGKTTSSTGSVIATPGSHQSIYGGGSEDAYLVKFNSSGVRQWGTYYGGSGSEDGYSCKTDNSGNVYLTGYTTSNTSTIIATTGSHQSAYSGTIDTYLVKFNSSGVRQWGTYYGGSGNDYGRFCEVDASGNVFLSGYSTTSSGTTIATPGSHQSTYGGGANDAFLVKFNATGVRQWGTYYGGAGDDNGYACSVDAAGNVYLPGYTTSNIGASIATLGSHQSVHGGGTYDGFLVKFNSAGSRQWGTYYGDIGLDFGISCSTDISGNVYLSGSTDSNSGTVIATIGSYQNTYGGGGRDAYLVQFNSSGIRQWGTYYGGTGDDNGNSSSLDGLNNIYLAGNTSSSTSTLIANPGSHQSAYGGGSNDSYLVKFSNCAAPANPITGPNQTICSGFSSTVTATSGTAAINWYATLTSTSIIGTSTAYITPTLSAGTYTYYAEAFTCGPSLTRTPVSITVNPSPVISVNSGSICSGSSFTITPSGASTYTIQGGNAVVSPTANTNYTVTGSSAVGCISSNIATSNVTVNPLPTINATTSSSLICTLPSQQNATLTGNGAMTYTWNPGGSGTSIVISPSVTTTYTVSGTDANGCENSAIITQSVSLCTGLSQMQIDVEGMAIYPNPNNGVFNIRVSEPGIYSIINSLGQTINLFEVKTQYEKIEVRGLSAGIYYVVGKGVRRKIVVEIE